jgi:hypothetical protein
MKHYTCPGSEIENVPGGKPLYEEGETVIVSGTSTGVGDVRGIVEDAKYVPMESSFYYVVKSLSSGAKFYANEKFLTI